MANYSAHVFERLRELNSKMFLPVRDFSAYEKLLYINEFSLGKYGKLFSRNELPYWLEIKRPEFDELPKVPVEVMDWIVDWGGQVPEKPPKVRLYFDNDEEFWLDDVSGAHTPNLSELYGERFDSEKKRVKIWEQWLSAAWLPWAKSNVEKLKAMETYESFWEIFQYLQRNPGKYELIWSTAILFWRTEGMDIRHPLLSQRMELEYDVEQGAFKLLAINKGVKLSYGMLFGLLGVDIEKLFDLEQSLLEESFDLREYTQLEKFCASLAQAIGHSCKISIEESLKEQQISRQPYIYYGEPVIALRKIDEGRWRAELETVVDDIQAGGQVYNVFCQYYKKDEMVKNLVEDDDEEYEEKEEQVLFPWPAEKRQEKIFKNVLENQLTVVQTLPSSEKTKLIANLLVNFLAKGMRVLVTGDSERSLQKITNLLKNEYKEILSLCIDATGTERQNAKALLSSLKAYNEQVNFTTRAEVMRERDFLQKKLENCKEDILKEKESLNRARKLEHSEYFIIEGVKRSPWQVAKWIKENIEDLGYIQDKIDFQEECPLNKSEMSRMFELAGQFSLEERQQLALWRPPIAELITTDELTKLFEELDVLAVDEMQRQEFLECCDIKEEIDVFIARSILVEYQQALSEFPIDEEKWLSAILKNTIKAGNSDSISETWEDFYHIAHNRLKKIIQLHEIVKDHEFVLPSDLTSTQLKKFLEALRAEFYKNGKISLLYKMATGKEAVKVLQGCFLDGVIPDSAQQIDIIIAKIDLLSELNVFVNKWDGALKKVSGPLFIEAEEEQIPKMEEYLQKIGNVISWHKKYFENLQKYWHSFSIKQENPNWTDRNWFMNMLSKLQHCCKEKQFEHLQEILQKQKDLVNNTDKPDEYYLDPICYMMEEALYNKDVEGWDICYIRLEALTEQKKSWDEFQALYNRLAKVAPLWTEELLSKGKDILHSSPKEWTAAWRLNQAVSWLDKHIEKNRLEELTEQFTEQVAKEKEFIKDVAVSSAWECQLRRVSKEESLALDYLFKKVDVSEDNGLSLPGEFWHEAEFWRSSLPGWIISINCLLETAGTFDKLFDVVIIDESEKNSIFSLPLLLRAKKAVVLGDNMLPVDKNFANAKKSDSALLEKMLIGLKEQEKFQLQDSLYDLAERLSETPKEVLGECVISNMGLSGFVNKYFYQERMTLLPSSYELDKLQPELLAVPVDVRQMTGVSNRDEAKFIYEYLTNMLEQPEYKEKSICIITLGNDEQQDILQEGLLEYIPEELVAKHGIVCTSAENYSDFKRDVVLVSLVSAKVAETNEFKYMNAVLSAAFEQVVLFHPFASKDISSRSIVSQLLKFVEPTEKPSKFAQTELVQEVLKTILEKGYEAKVASDYSDCFDIIVQKDGYNIAVVCDGLRNQTELDIAFAQEESYVRNGWQFYHLSGCKFYLNSESALENLWYLLARLDSM